MKLKRYIWFADQEDMDFAEATNFIGLPSDAGSHLGLELLRFDLKHFLVAFLTTQFKGFPLAHYMTANK